MDLVYVRAVIDLVMISLSKEECFQEFPFQTTDCPYTLQIPSVILNLNSHVRIISITSSFGKANFVILLKKIKFYKHLLNLFLLTA